MSYRSRNSVSRAADASIIVEDSGSLLLNNYKYHPISEGHIFPHEPCTQDIAQDDMGNCYLLAVLISIVNHPDGAAYIRSMIQEHPQHVVVRLYQKEATASAEPTYRPVYYRMRKTILYKNRVLGRGSTLNSHQARWVNMIEKAYAIHRITYCGEFYQPEEPAIDDNGKTKLVASGPKRRPLNFTEALTAGIPEDAYAILFGSSAQGIYFQSDQFTKNKALQVLHDIFNFLPLSNMFIDPSVPLLEPGPGRPFSAAEIRNLRDIFGAENNVLIERFLRSIKSENFLNAQSKFSTQQTPRYNELYEFVVANYDPAFQPALLEYIRNHVPRKRGQGNYLDRQQNLYTTIETAIRGRQLICASSSANMGNGEANRAPSRREHQVKGLAGPHAYAVIGMGGEHAIIPDLDSSRPNQLKFVWLVNPWQSYVREYQVKQHSQFGDVLSAHSKARSPTKLFRGSIPNNAAYFSLNAAPEKNGGGFPIELTDFTKRFNRITIANLPILPSAVEAGRERHGGT